MLDRHLSWTRLLFVKIKFQASLKTCLLLSQGQQIWHQKSLFWMKCLGWMRWTVADMIEVWRHLFPVGLTNQLVQFLE